MYCPYIKNGLTINHDGDMVPCCTFKENSGLNATDKSIDEYFSSNFLSDLRSKFDAGVWPSGCRSCQTAEDNKQLSLRLNAIPQRELFEKYYVDLNIGNECNSDCVMCNPESSTKIVSRLKKHGTIDGVEYNLDFFKDNQSWFKSDKTWDDIENNIENISCIKFLGGEPFLNKTVWKWLESERIQHNKHNITLQITTNGSILLEDKLTLLSGWKKLLVNVSIDATNGQFEWIRQGLKWSTVEHNTKKLSSINNAITAIQVVVSVYSITGIADLLEWADSNDYLVGIITSLVNPAYLALKYSPVDVLEKTLVDLKKIKLKRKQNKIQLLSLIKFINKSIAENAHNPDILEKITKYFNAHRTKTMDSTSLTLVET